MTLLETLRTAGARAAAFSTSEHTEATPWRRMLISVEEPGIWIRCAFMQDGGVGKTEFLIGWDDVAEDASVIDLGIGRCIDAMDEALSKPPVEAPEVTNEDEAA